MPPKPKRRPEPPDDGLLTVRQLAARMQLTEDWIMAKVRVGEIPAFKWNARTFRFHWESVLAALPSTKPGAKHRIPGKP